MPIELIILLAALLVSWLVFSWVIKVLKASVKTALAIATIVLILQLAYGIGPAELWNSIFNLPQLLWQTVTEVSSPR